MQFQKTLDGKQFECIKDLQILIELYEEDHRRKLTELEQAVLFGNLPNPAIIDSRSSEESGQVVWMLPGRGEASRFDGWYSRLHACPDGDYYKPEKHQCGKLSCPSCCWDKMDELGNNIAEKIESVRGLFHPNSVRDQCLQHVVVSVPRHLWTEIYDYDGFKILRKKASQIASEIGILGGAVIFHPFRRNGTDDDKLPVGYDPEADNDLDPMTWRLGPHFHIIGYGFIEQASEDWIKRHDGWLFSSLRTGGNALKTKDDLFTASRYVISHTGIPTGDIARYQTITYIGEMNSRNCRVYATLTASKPLECPTCGQICRCLELDYQNDKIIDKGESIVKIDFPFYGKKSDRSAIEWTLSRIRNNPNMLFQYSEILQSSIGRSRYLAMQSDGWTFKIHLNCRIDHHHRR